MVVRARSSSSNATSDHVIHAAWAVSSAITTKIIMLESGNESMGPAAAAEVEAWSSDCKETVELPGHAA